MPQTEVLVGRSDATRPGLTNNEQTANWGALAAGSGYVHTELGLGSADQVQLAHRGNWTSACWKASLVRNE